LVGRSCVGVVSGEGRQGCGCCCPFDRSIDRSIVGWLVGWLVGSFVRSSVRPFVCSSVRPFVRSSVRLFVRSSVRPFVRSSVRPFVRSSVPSSVRPFVCCGLCCGLLPVFIGGSWRARSSRCCWWLVCSNSWCCLTLFLVGVGGVLVVLVSVVSCKLVYRCCKCSLRQSVVCVCVCWCWYIFVLTRRLCCPLVNVCVYGNSTSFFWWRKLEQKRHTDAHAHRHTLVAFQCL